jgi:hypothetical protein
VKICWPAPSAACRLNSSAPSEPPMDDGVLPGRARPRARRASGRVLGNGNGVRCGGVHLRCTTSLSARRRTPGVPRAFGHGFRGSTDSRDLDTVPVSCVAGAEVCDWPAAGWNWFIHPLCGCHVTTACMHRFAAPTLGRRRNPGDAILLRRFSALAKSTTQGVGGCRMNRGGVMSCATYVLHVRMPQPDRAQPRAVVWRACPRSASRVQSSRL